MREMYLKVKAYLEAATAQLASPAAVDQYYEDGVAWLREQRHAYPDQPWLLYGLGGVVAIMLLMAGVPMLAFALGMYLPISINAAVLAGAVCAWLISRTGGSERVRKARSEQGTLIASGMMAGAAMLAADLVAYQDARYAGRFLDTVEEVAGVEPQPRAAHQRAGRQGVEIQQAFEYLIGLIPGFRTRPAINVVPSLRNVRPNHQLESLH